MTSVSMIWNLPRADIRVPEADQNSSDEGQAGHMAKPQHEAGHARRF